ncbi:MAG: CDP-alcohol phosphatidyltransferase family protein [Actinomycetota bacterium]|nr:CDP-alcohol phosphatidyltransferase family protein [Actinomycetota bacterium]
MATETTGPAAPGFVRSGEDRILTVPNVITTIRLLCVPLFLWLLLRGPHHRGWYPAALLLGALGASDGVDGFVARRFRQVSTVGKVLDPIADRLLLGVAAISTIVLGAVPLWVGILAIAREGLVALGFLVVASLGGRRMDVVWAGKAGTFGLMAALPLFLGGHANDDWRATAETLAWIFAVPGLLLGWYAATTYVPKARLALADGRRERAAGGQHGPEREGVER